jgi:putative transposase
VKLESARQSLCHGRERRSVGTARPLLPAARPGGRRIRAVINATFYLLRTGCEWRLLPREFPAWGTVYHYFRMWKNSGVWTCLQREIYEGARRKAGRSACPS